VIEEQGRVVAVELGAVWVETLRKSTCSSCSVKAGCGQSLLDQLSASGRRGFVRALSNLQLDVGDRVIIGVREDLLVRGSLLVYLLPLLGLFAAAVSAEQVGLSEPWVILSALFGFLLACCAVRWRSRITVGDPALQPVVLRALLTSAAAAL
jgi:sigma-E factor negative regulatory protein RseC